MEEIFRTLNKQQHGVMDALCTMKYAYISAAEIKPGTLGSLCTKKLVNVEDGKVSATCSMLCNMTFHKELFDMISQECIDDISVLIKAGYRIIAIQKLRESTGWSIHEAKGWMDINFPK